MHLPTEKWPSVARVLRYVLKPELLTPQDAETLQTLCTKDIFAKCGGVIGNSPSSLSSLALLMKISFIQKQQFYTEINISKILLLYLRIMIDRAQPLITLDKLAQVMTNILETIKEELQNGHCEREALNILGELIEVTCLFCQNANISEMNKSLFPLLNQQNNLTQYVLSETTTELSNQQAPLTQLFLHTRNTHIFEDFLCALVKIELSYSAKREAQFESSFSCRLVTKISNFIQEQPKVQNILFLVRLLKLTGQKSPAGIFSNFLSCLKIENKSQIGREMRAVLECILSFKDDHTIILDEYTRQFNRKRNTWLFAETSAIIIELLENITQRTKFLTKVTQVMQYQMQQSFQVQQDDLQILIDCIAKQFKVIETKQTLNFNDQIREEFKQNMMKLWFLLAISNMITNKKYKNTLMQLSSITPVIVYDQDVQLWIRSAAKNTELDFFAESVFEMLQSEVLNSRSVKLDQIVRTSASKSQQGSTNTKSQKQKVVETDPSDLMLVEDDENIEVGQELSLPERVFLALFCEICRLKIQVNQLGLNSVQLGSSFVQQIVSVFSTEANFNQISQNKSISITQLDLQKINTPFGKQLDLLSKALINVHLDQVQTQDWSNDYSFLIRSRCSDSWTTRYIATFMCQLYFMRQPCVTKQILEAFSQVFNALYNQTSQVYSSLSAKTLIQGEVITMPEDMGLLKKIHEDLVNLIAQQYVASCILGNRAQLDFTIQQLVQDSSLTSTSGVNYGKRILQSLVYMEVKLERVNTFDLTLKFKRGEHQSFAESIQAIYQKIKQSLQGAGLFFLPQNQKQTNLTLIQPYEQVEHSKLLLQVKDTKSQNSQSQILAQDFSYLIQQAASIVQTLEMCDTIADLENKGVKRNQLLDLLVNYFSCERTKTLRNQDTPLTLANQFLNTMSAFRYQNELNLQELVKQITPLATDPIKVSNLISVLSGQQGLLIKYLMYLHSDQNEMVEYALKTLQQRQTRHVIPRAKEWKKQVGRLSNPVKRSIRQQVILPHKLQSSDKLPQLIEQYQQNHQLNIDIVAYLKSLGHQVDKLVANSFAYDDLYSQLMYVKVTLETSTNINAVQKLALNLLGRQFKSTSIEEVKLWIQLLTDIKYLVHKDEVVLQYLLSHFKWQIISWNFQFQITQAVGDFTTPILSSKEAQKLVNRWPELALKMYDLRINPRFVDSYAEALHHYIQSNPQKFLRKSQSLDVYLNGKSVNKLFTFIWRTDNIIHMAKFLSLKTKNNLLKCQLALKALEVASPKKIIFFLPQLFQSLRIDSSLNNLIADFLIRKSQQFVSVAHNVLWFCKVESAQPDEKELHGRKVPLPQVKENLNQITSDLYKIILNQLGVKERQFFETETEFFEKITSISGLLQPSQSKDQKKTIIKDKLIEYNREIPDCVYLPTNQNCRVVGIVTTSGMPMQSAARVPILVSFEVEEYPGPDNDPSLQHTTLIRSVMHQGITLEKSQISRVQSILTNFQAKRAPVTSEIDLDDDDSVIQNGEEFTLHEAINNMEHKLIGSSEQVPLNANSIMHQLTRQLIPKRTMFESVQINVGGKLSQLRVDQTNVRKDELQKEEEEDQRQFMKNIKQQTFKQTNEKLRERTSIMHQFINLNREPTGIRGIIAQQLGGTTPLKLQHKKSLNQRSESFDNQSQLPASTAIQISQTKIISCIFKVNDDLRQDILALQVIKHFQRIFKENDLDLFVAPYRCISNRTGADKLLGGIIEVVPNSHSRDQLGKAFEINLHEYFLKKYGSESTPEFKNARYNFIRSLAAYAVVSFILQIKDRHNGNILIDESGHLIHIDFGFIFDWSPGKDMRFESAAFKLTQEFIDILGGSPKAPAFRLFENLVIQGYLAVRDHSEDFLNLTELMFYSGFPCFKPYSLQNLETRFRKDLSQAEAARWMRDLVQDAANKWTTRVYDYVQYKQNKIVF